MLGGTNSLHTNALDETLALPTEQAAEIALRTQQVLMEETGVVNVADPLGRLVVRRGAHRQDRGGGEGDLRPDPRDRRLRPALVRHRGLARESARCRRRERQRRPMTSGILRGIEDGWFMSEIAEAAFQYQMALEKGDKKDRRGQRPHDSVTDELEILRVSHEVETEQVRELAPSRPTRDQAAVDPRSPPWWRSRAPTPTSIPAMMDAVRAEATPRRDLRRPARRVGRVPRARAVLTASARPRAAR